MKLIFILLLITLSQSAKLHQDFPEDFWLSDEYIEYVQSKATTWKVGRNFHKESSIKNLVRRLGYLPIKGLSFSDSFDIYEVPKEFSLPDTFDSREKWNFCPTIKEIRDQGSCGSCWAISSVEVMSDRTCIHSDGKHNFHFSTEDLLSCCTSCGFGCDGGDPNTAFWYWRVNGIVSGGQYNSSEGCKPYKIAPCEHHIDGERPDCSSYISPTPECERKCESSYATSYVDDLHRSEKVYSLKYGDAMNDLITNGPISACFDVYSDFFSYKSGVYQRTEGATYLGGHAIRIIGYGSENGVPYWLCANSWNSDWGDKGLFKILRGKNECKIEASLLAGIPRL